LRKNLGEVCYQHFKYQRFTAQVQWKWGDENIKNGVDATELQAVEGKRMIAGMLGDLIGQNESLLVSHGSGDLALNASYRLTSSKGPG
jgi:hypothetical protein